MQIHNNIKSVSVIKDITKVLKKRYKQILIISIGISILVVSFITLYKYINNPIRKVEKQMEKIEKLEKVKNTYLEQQHKIDDKIKELKKQIEELNKNKKEIQNKINEINNLIEKEREKIFKDIINFKDDKLKQIAISTFFHFIPNMNILKKKYYYTGKGEKAILTVKQKMLNWRLNSKGASKSFLYLKGNTIEERTKYLLSLYGLENTFDIWKKAEQIYKIKKEVLVCIARADSDLGKQLKSKNNLGNVGNNDRGNVVHFKTIKDGIFAIAKVLNNRYLGHYSIIGELSEGGRRNLKLPSCKVSGVYCYATSRENWNNNVINCLSMIYNKPINEYFNFRVNNSSNVLLSKQ